MSQEREIERWVTIKGHRVPIYKKSFQVTSQQKDWENGIRNDDKEHLAYFDKDGNKLFETEGTKDDVSFGTNYEDSDDWDKVVQFNHEVEQRVWQDQEINGTHNHPENTIFSPEDIEGFEALENHSMRAVLPNGTNYTLIREQPRTSNEHIYDEATGEFHRKFEPKHITEAYREAYLAVYENDYRKMRNETSPFSPERQQAEVTLDKKVAREMEKWLKANASKYGYRFVKE